MAGNMFLGDMRCPDDGKASNNDGHLTSVMC